MSVTEAVISHYARADIAPRILAALAETAGPDTPVTPEALAPLDHFHSRGVAATEALCRLLDPQPGEAVLDIGCGIGGPARWIAARTGCRVTGVDLTPDFVAAATALAAATGQSGTVRFLEGSALALPVPDAAFDRAYSQNVVMNIADKAAVYAEARRVLRPGGVLALSNLTALDAAGFEILAFHDVSDDIVAFNQALRGSGRPRLGMGVLVGEAIVQRQRNSARGLAEGRLRAIEVLARRR
jgi:SAM-dependent methyltransferase